MLIVWPEPSKVLQSDKTPVRTSVSSEAHKNLNHTLRDTAWIRGTDPTECDKSTPTPGPYFWYDDYLYYQVLFLPWDHEYRSENASANCISS